MLYIIMLHYGNTIMLLYEYVCRETCFVYAYMYVLTSIFIQTGMH